jgi:hypothetical protein
MKIGEIYFIREKDRKYGDISSYVKIGMVGDTERGSQQRMSEHQTGNPRDLELHHVTQTPNPFRVEKFLHQRFGAQRVKNEWFELTDQDLEEAIRVSEQLSEEAFVYLPIIEAAKGLAGQLSDQDVIATSEGAIEWHRKLTTSKEALSVCRAMRGEYLSVAEDMTPDVREEIEQEELILTETFIVSIFDDQVFATKYPHLLDAFTLTSTNVSGKFIPKKMTVDLNEVDRDLASFRDSFFEACQSVRDGSLGFQDLFQIHRDLEVFEGAYEWDNEVADAHLRVLCGTSAGIEGLCTWKRTEKTTSVLDKEGLESDHPDEFGEFHRTELRTRKRPKKRAPKHK